MTGVPRVAVSRRTMLGVVLIVLAVELVWAAPYVAGAAGRIGAADARWVALAVLAELVSIMTFVRLQRVMLREAGVDVPMARAAAATLGATAMSITLPAGNAASAAYTARRMLAFGADAALIAFALVSSGALSFTALGLLAAVGGTLDGDVSGMLVAALEVGTVLAMLVGFVVVLRHPRHVHAVLARGLRLARRDPEVAARVAADLAAIRPRARSWLRAGAFAVLNRTADLACFLAAASAIGVGAPVRALVLAYLAAVAAAASVPLVPAGLGLMEAAGVAVLVGSGVPVAEATAAVVVYRLISLGAVAVAGWLVVLHGRGRRGTGRSDPACGPGVPSSERRAYRGGPTRPLVTR